MRTTSYDLKTAETTKPVESEERKREKWKNPLEFLFSCISMSVGLGNVWRFPFTAYENGGGAFLIPYLIVIFFIGKPLYFMEMAIGQFSSSGPVEIWHMCPIFKGIGYASAYGSFCVGSYYSALMAITLYYFLACFQPELPWARCRNTWENVTCGPNNTAWIQEPEPLENGTRTIEESVARLYYKREVLLEYENIDNGIGIPEWRLALLLLLSWIIICACLVKGVTSSGKLAYFTALFPYVVLITLLVRGLTLKGSLNGIWYFIRPEWHRLLDPKVWSAAVGQCFFSLNTGFGPIIMLSSFNDFRQNVYKDAMIISLTDTFTSLLAGCTIFAILGYLAFDLGIDISEVTDAGPGLAFISYPTAISKIRIVPQLFAVLFFLMLFTMGVGTATTLSAGVISIIHDKFPKVSNMWITIGVCCVGFLVGLIYVTPGGQFMLTLVDYFGVNFVIYIIAAVEIMAISWVYGLSNIIRDIEFMLKVKITWYWKLCWGFVVPVGLAAIFFYTLLTMEPLVYDNVRFPHQAIVCGWILLSSALLFLPCGAFHSICQAKGEGMLEKIKEACQPQDDWGPSNEALYQEWTALPTPKSLFRRFVEFIRCKKS